MTNQPGRPSGDGWRSPEVRGAYLDVGLTADSMCGPSETETGFLRREEGRTSPPSRYTGLGPECRRAANRLWTALDRLRPAEVERTSTSVRSPICEE